MCAVTLLASASCYLVVVSSTTTFCTVKGFRIVIVTFCYRFLAGRRTATTAARTRTTLLLLILLSTTMRSTELSIMCAWCQFIELFLRQIILMQTALKMCYSYCWSLPHTVLLLSSTSCYFMLILFGQQSAPILLQVLSIITYHIASMNSYRHQ